MRAGDFVVVSGQVGIADGALVPGGVAAQTTRAMENLSALLGSAGASLNDVVKTTCYLVDMDDFDTFNAAYAAALGAHRPHAGDHRRPRPAARGERRDRGLGLLAPLTGLIGRRASTALRRMATRAVGGRGTSLVPMAGAVAIVIALLLIPVLVLMAGAVGSALFGELLYRDGRARAEGSELLELDD